MVEISKLSWESGGKIRSFRLHTNSVWACISIAPKQLSLENEFDIFLPIHVRGAIDKFAEFSSH